MRIVIAPDCFTGTLSASQAADAMGAGWRSVRPADELVLLPMSDGGPGFLDALPGTRVSVLVEDPLARPVTAELLLDGATAYVESAQACGLHLLDPADRDPAWTTTYGVGQLVVAALDAGATTVVLGLGGSATNDGGAGFLAALGVRREDTAGERLAPGCLPLSAAARLVGQPRPVQLVAATDVDSPLLGPFGATRTFGPQKGARDLDALEEALAHWADLLEQHLDVRARDEPGAGAAGGLGFALLALGAERVRGADVVAQAAGLADAVAGADLVVTGEGCFDVTSLRGKVVAAVASAAQREGLPCLVLAGHVEVGERQAASAGVEASYALGPNGLHDAGGALCALAAHVARQWGV